MKLFKKLGVLLTAATLFVTSLTVIPLNVNAKEPYMKEANVRWNLEPDKEVTFKANYVGYGYIPIKAKIENFKIEKADEEGYKKLTFSAKYKNPKLKLSKKQVDKIVASDGGLGYMFTLLDYKTGKSLEYENDFDVKVSNSGWKYSKSNYKYYGHRGAWCSHCKTSKIKITVIYPEDYKDLCIGVCGSTDPFNEVSEFLNGEVPFKKSTFYKKGKKDLSSFMRVKDFE